MLSQKNVFVALTKPKPEIAEEARPIFDYLENVLENFAKRPFFLGKLSLVHIAYGPFLEKLSTCVSCIEEL